MKEILRDFCTNAHGCIFYVGLCGTVDVTEWYVAGFLYDVMSFT